MWLDRLLMLIEIGILLWMVRLDRINQTAISRFLRERTEWYARRAHQKTQKAQEQSSPEPSEIVTVLEESELEQSENSSGGVASGSSTAP